MLLLLLGGVWDRSKSRESALGGYKLLADSRVLAPCLTFTATQCSSQYKCHFVAEDPLLLKVLLATLALKDEGRSSSGFLAPDPSLIPEGPSIYSSCPHGNL